MGEGRKGEVFYWYSIVAGFLDNDEIETPSDVSMEYLDDIFRKPPFCRVRPLVLDKIGSEIVPEGVLPCVFCGGSRVVYQQSYTWYTVTIL